MRTFIGGYRLRSEDNFAGIGPPMYEEQTLLEAGLTQGAKLIIEQGPTPLKSQVKIVLDIICLIWMCDLFKTVNG